METGQETWELVSGGPAKVGMAIRIKHNKTTLELPTHESLCFLDMEIDPLLEPSLCDTWYKNSKPRCRLSYV